jgi:hypothetical protein
VWPPDKEKICDLDSSPTGHQTCNLLDPSTVYLSRKHT